MTISAPAVAFDEAFAAAETPRAHYAAVLAAVRDAGPATLRDIAAPAGADPIPLVFTAAEWATLAAGLEQRARALDALAADAHTERRAVAAGVIAADVLDASPHLARDLWAAPPPDAWVSLAAFDVVRLPGGTLAVRNDDVLGADPTGLPALRELTDLRRRVAMPPRDVQGPALGFLRALLGDPASSAILTDEPSWSSGGELRRLGVPVLGLGEVTARRGRLTVRHDGRTLDAVWLRTADQRLRTPDGGLTALGDAVFEALLHGTLTVINHPGSAVAAGVPSHLPDVIEALLGEEPLIGTAPDAGLPLSAHPTVGASGAIEPRAVELRAFAVRNGRGYEVVPGGIGRVSGGGAKDVWVLDDPSRFGR